MNLPTTCPGCQTRYLIPSDGIPPGGRKVACGRCGHRWVLTPPSQEAPSGPLSSKEPPKPSPSPPVSSAMGEVIRCPHCRFHYHISAARALQPEGQTILVAEDQDFFRNLIRESLGERYTYIVAGTVGEARVILAKVPVDLVILDLNLEEARDGEQVLETAGARKVPALILTGDDDPDLFGDKWKEYQEMGARDLLIKGLNIREELLVKVKAILEGGNEIWSP